MEKPLKMWLAVYEEEEQVVYTAYDTGTQVSLEDSRVASGWVKGHWSGKTFKVITYSAIGPVDLKGGGEAQLVAVGHEYYEDGAFSEPDTNEKVDLHWFRKFKTYFWKPWLLGSCKNMIVTPGKDCD